ncbi:hypothetical protein K9U34_06705 [Lawsonia intracellularis]|uniref:Glycosyltransferase n=1 Tax=Lawsonia intracellularis (strain PHE/MN1-00) TaxID=363253 RepID=Q1MNZ2_LAWIP|nr:hypothetical protein [Lawsonia intracellularis]AGC50661.1 hypothetical protein LAW_20014 [Lawsonia intracellularis N343]KAA0204222.1 hypothetical protein C4K43_06695 [Lawsonia intracellularis]MBZ3893280.1 hypothetical protein [Lawsonia intracellularis]RBN31874.1 hypothetical protein DR194_07105 [Lawsonia intracellularis]RBN32647.1 hypothetical protein DR192_07110 [Lawsonia intracellularis]
MFPSRKIFIGLEDIASIIENYTLGFNSLGFDVFSVVNSQASICASPCDIVLKDHLPPLRRRMTMRQKQEYIQKRINLIRKVFEKAIKECDIFLFIWSSFSPDYSDLPILKALGKKIIFVFVGSDCRWRTAYNQDMLQHGLDILPPGFNDGEQQLKEITLRLIMAEKYADALFNTPSQAGLALRPYYNYLQYPLNAKKYESNNPQNKIPVILHAPSDRFKKGSDMIEAIFLQLQKDGLQFTPRVVQGVPHNKAIEIYKEVDILAGQLGTVTGGKQERELMACRKVVVSGLKPEDYPQLLSPDCPNVRSHSLRDMYMALKMLIPNVSLREKIASCGPSYVRTYHDPSTACAKYLDAINGTTSPDFIPRFLRDTFVPEKKYLPVYNTRIKLVQDCPWYKEYIEPGTRLGLVF